jgi:hypothetical protein
MNEVYGIKQWTLMQDGATAHTSKTTIDYLQLYVNILENWPSSSPDMNPIENLWAIMKWRIAELHPQNIRDLIRAIRDVWESLTKVEIQKLIDSMHERLNATIQANGDHNGFLKKIKVNKNDTPKIFSLGSILIKLSPF